MGTLVTEHQRLFIILGLIVLALIIVLVLIFNKKCSQCHRYNALKWTGESRYEDNDNWFSVDTGYDKYQCIHCGHTEWIAHWGNSE